MEAFLTVPEAVQAIKTCGYSVDIMYRDAATRRVKRSGLAMWIPTIPQTGKLLTLVTVDLQDNSRSGQHVTINPDSILAVYAEDGMHRVANVRYDRDISLWIPR